jgi:3-methyl-2-oxobutanoate hydroxymethyltransferase
MKYTAPHIRRHKRRDGKEPLVMVTAYDEPGARFASLAGVDIILVGDSVGNTTLGFPDTLHVTIDDMVRHVAAVARATPNAHIVGDMPWLSYHTGASDAVRAAGQLIRAGADSVKLEGGHNRLDVVRAIIDAEIPVMGHVGLTPQSVLAMGGMKVQAKKTDAAQQLVADALALQEAGIFAIVIEGVPPLVGDKLTEALSIPTIGIGAGAQTDGQVLVYHDLLGLGKSAPPKFVRSYADVGSLITDAIARYASDVRTGHFPGPDETYQNPTDLAL